MGVDKTQVLFNKTDLYFFPLKLYNYMKCFHFDFGLSRLVSPITDSWLRPRSEIILSQKSSKI